MRTLLLCLVILELAAAMQCQRLTRQLPTLRQLSSSVAATREIHPESSRPRNVTVLGGGLAGLSTAYHLLTKAAPGSRINIVDKAEVGTAGASSVAGGLLHPLSPRGKLIHWGLEGLAATAKLVDTASRHGDNVILRKELYRVALSPQNVEQFQTTAALLPDLCDWLKAEDIPNCEGSKVLGGLRLSNGCKVIHVPSYLQGLWNACEHVAAERGCSTSWSVSKKADVRASGDTVVYAAGNGLFQNGILSNVDLPIQLVRGQSLELRMPDHEHEKPALLCGKYLSPLPDPQLALLGATQEFKETAFTRSEVIAELKKRTDGAFVWNEDQIHRVTTGTRVQSERGKYGRLPIVGRLRGNEWIFTGLSSRGLVYHGVYGELLADAILTDSEETMLEKCADLHWWKSKVDL